MVKYIQSCSTSVTLFSGFYRGAVVYHASEELLQVVWCPDRWTARNPKGLTPPNYSISAFTERNLGHSHPFNALPMYFRVVQAGTLREAKPT